MNAKDCLRVMRCDVGLLQRTDCTKEENDTYINMIKENKKLPDGVYQYRNLDSGEVLNEFYTVTDNELTDAEKQEYILSKLFAQVQTIKKCVVFFTALTIISLAASVLFFIFTAMK